MAGGVNKVILIGNLGADPDLRHLPDGTAVANVRLATSESFKNRAGEKQEKTEWHRVSFFGRQAEVVGDYLRKGSKIYVEGSLQTRKWQDKETGQDRYTTEIRSWQMVMLDSRGGGDDYGGGDNFAGGESGGGRSGGGSRPRQTERKGESGGGKDSPFDDLGSMEDDVPF